MILLGALPTGMEFCGEYLCFEREDRGSEVFGRTLCGKMFLRGRYFDFTEGTPMLNVDGERSISNPINDARLSKTW